MEFKEYFQQPYQGGDSFLQEVVFPIFGEETFENKFYTSILDENPELETIARTTGIESIYLIGTIQVEFNPIDIFDIKVTNHVQMARNRVAIQQLVRRIMNTYSSAFMIFHYEDTKNWDWRFTFCSKKGSNDDTTDSKRYTFLLGPNQSCRTASENFCKLLQKHGDIEVKDIEAAFDVEALSKEFFSKYKQHYQRFVDYMCNDENGIRQSFIDTSFDHTEMDAKKIKDREEKPIRDYVKKLLGRIVFLHFLQKKGWMGVPQDKPWGQGDTNFMKHLFEKCTEDQKENFLDEVLEPLFSDALDTDRSSDDFLFDTNVKLDCGSVVKIPYLNGGLFERDYLDEPETRFPVEYFADLFEFFYQYNFTIDENDPNDAQLGVDPEMLGRIFENLLEDNKDKGAFYTPKEIVQYMCRQSLIAYLQTDVDNEETKTAIESFVKTYNVELLGGTDSELSKSLDNRLKDVKICDPAIGSGAFPMGLLKELFLCRGAIEKFDDAASIKRHIIQQNIYGVDIEHGAVDIARLRFWLSLIVDEETPHSLPNLDYKIMQGNSLLESFMGLDLSTLTDDQIKIAKKNKGQVSLIFDEADTKKNIQIYLEQYFSESNHSLKSQIRQAIENTVKEHIKICAGYDPKVVAAVDDITIPNDKFFLWHTYFSDVFNRPSGCNGFDIVIGNPPYVLIPKAEFNKLYKSQFQHQEGKIDLYRLFVELCFSNLSKINGIISLIIPNTILTISSCRKLRGYIFQYQPLYICNCKDLVFEASVNSILISFQLDKWTTPTRIMTESINDNEVHVHYVDSSDITEMGAPINIFIDNKNKSILHKCISFMKLEDINDIEICLGEQPYHNTIHCKQQIASRFLHSKSQLSKSYIVELGGKHIYRYGVKLINDNFLNYDGELYTKPDMRFFSGERIIIREIVSNTLVGTYTKQTFLCNKACYILRGKGIDLKYLLALLNSKFIGYYVSVTGDKANQKLFPRISMKALKSLPIPMASDVQLRSIVSIVDEVLDDKLDNSQSDTSAKEAEINRLVYQLYGLTDDEIRIVEGE